MMFKAWSFVAFATLLVHSNAKPYMNSLNEAVTSYLNVPNNNAPLDGTPMIQASSMMNIPDYVQSSPSYHQTGSANVAAAIQTKRTVEVKPILLQSDPIEPHVVDVEASFQPVQVVFRSSSSPVMVQQIHTPAQTIQVEPTQSEDEPHRVQHQVMRPVIQEIREIIQPYRRVLQEIRPVLEEVRTIVAKAEGTNVSNGPGAPNAAGAINGGDGTYGPGGPGILLATDTYGGNNGNGPSYGRPSMRSVAPLRKNYSRRSGSTQAFNKRQYSDRARS